jgi:hypothetical protein
MVKPVSTPPSGEAPAEVLTPLQKVLTGTLLLSLITVPIFSFGFYLAPFYKAAGAPYRGDFWIYGALLGVALSAAFAFVWMTWLPAFLEKRQTRREERATAAREERRLAKKREAEKSRADRVAAAAAAAAAPVTAMAADEEE